MKSIQPRKTRKRAYNAPLHKRQKMVRAHLSKALREQRKKRSFGVRKGDTVKVMRGRFKGRTGKVTRVDLGPLKVMVEGIVVKKQTGKEVLAKIDPSNLMITELVERKK